jgi:hypothetical protein
MSDIQLFIKEINAIDKKEDFLKKIEDFESR